MPPNLHVWRMFIKPTELRRELKMHGLADRDFVGLKPSGNPLQLIKDLRCRRRGEIGFAELARALDVREGRDLSISYAGYAVRT